jgi:hypothetical protein
MASDAIQTLLVNMKFIPGLIYWLVAFACGCVAATAELFSRYSDGPVRIFQFKESYMYLALNGVVSLIAYAIIQKTGLSFGPLGNSSISQAILAGFSSMAILRSSVASIKRGQTTVQVGLAPIMQIFLDTVDRAFDRKRSQVELRKVGQIMKNVDFSKAMKDLPSTCINLMQNVSKEEQEKMGRDVADLAKSGLNSQTKAVNLGIIISRVTGSEFLESAVDSLGDTIRIISTQPTDTGEKQLVIVQEDRIKELKKKFL